MNVYLGPAFFTSKEKMLRTVESSSRFGFAAKLKKSCFPTKYDAAFCIAARSSGR